MNASAKSGVLWFFIYNRPRWELRLVGDDSFERGICCVLSDEDCDRTYGTLIVVNPADVFYYHERRERHESGGRVVFFI
ncbi:hypothetical protein [Gimesia chilikensis]|uniref:hypothetical protein n=1 Tax=Gimesia chilikensis TaxID=2605989 RepID=UPI003A8DB81A